MNPGDHQRGVIAALGAFTLWGLMPVYFKWLLVVPPLEIIMHRIVWSIPFLAGFLLLRDGPGVWRKLKLPARSMATLCVSSALIAVNWLLFVWAVNNDRILATSLGYFINPLVNVLLGFLFLHERLSRLQTAAVGLAALGTAYLTWFLGVAPWISLALATTFGFYGLVRKKLGVGPMIGLLWEALLLTAPACIYLAWAVERGTLAFTATSLPMDALMVLAGPLTVLPLVWFNVAARFLPLSTVGFFQYLAPTITFLLAVFVYGEPFTRGHAVAFGCIWSALALISLESILRGNRSREM